MSDDFRWMPWWMHPEMYISWSLARLGDDPTGQRTGDGPPEHRTWMALMGPRSFNYWWHWWTDAKIASEDTRCSTWMIILRREGRHKSWGGLLCMWEQCLQDRATRVRMVNRCSSSPHILRDWSVDSNFTGFGTRRTKDHRKIMASPQLILVRWYHYHLAVLSTRTAEGQPVTEVVFWQEHALIIDHQKA